MCWICQWGNTVYLNLQQLNSAEFDENIILLDQKI